MAKIVNVVAVADLGVQVDLAQLALRFPDQTWYDTSVYLGLVALRARTRAKALLYHTGKVVCVGTKSPTAAKKFLRRVLTEMGLGRYVSFRVVNIVAQWSLASRAKNETHRLEEPKAYVKVSHRGRVYCMGVKSRSDLDRVFKTIK